MKNLLSEENNQNLIILCPKCFKNIPIIKIVSPFIFYWCKCFIQDKDKENINLYDIFQWKKILYKDFLKSIININNSNLDLSSLSEIVYCETHPNNKEIYYGCQSKQTHCENCKNPGENNITIEQHFNELMDNINDELTKDITDILFNENFLICKIYKILIKELKINKIINSNIIKSFKLLKNLLLYNKDKLREISEDIEKYIPINTINVKNEINISRYCKIDKKQKLIDIDEFMSNLQNSNNKLGSGEIYKALLFKTESNGLNNKTCNYLIIILISIGNVGRGDLQCSIYNYSLFPIKRKIQYKKPNNSFRFLNASISLSKYGKDKFICAGNQYDFSPIDSIFIYSINEQNPIQTIPINGNESYILIHTLFNNKNDISFVLLSKDINAQILTGEDSGIRHLYFYDNKNVVKSKETINKIFKVNNYYFDKTTCLYIKNKNILVILFKFKSSIKFSIKSSLLFYNINERKYKLLSHTSNEDFPEKDIMEPFLMSMCTDDDYLYSLNFEKNIVQKWDCISGTCLENININLNQINSSDNLPKFILLNNLRLVKFNNKFEKLLIQIEGKFEYYYRDNKCNELIEGMEIVINDGKFSPINICIIEDNSNDNSDEYLFFIENKKFYMIQNC